MIQERKEFLSDVVITAVEGGIGYWAEVKDYQFGSDEASAMIRVNDDPDMPWRTLSIHTIQRGIKRLATGKYGINQTLLDWIVGGSATNEAGNIDSDCADVIVQVGILDEIVYG